MKKYSSQCILSAAAILALFAAFNWVVDPYWILEAPKIKHFNLNKPYAYQYSRIFKITNILHDPPQALIIGTSRQDLGIDPNHPVFRGRSVFNAGTGIQPFLESKEILQSLSGKDHFPKLIVFGLLFENANVFGHPLPEDYTKDNFEETRRYKLLFSLSTLITSAQTVAKNWIGEEEQTSQKNGFNTMRKSIDQDLLFGQRIAFKNSEKYFLNLHYPSPACKSALVADTANGKSASPMQDLREAIAIAYRMKADMRMFIDPSHARQWELIQASGLWEQFEDWKRMLIEMVESEAVKAQAPPFKVWNFSNYNSISEEDVTSAKDPNKRMRYYYDSSHYTPAVGDLVLDRIFNLKYPERTIPGDFGVLLSSRNIEAHLANIRIAREHYRQTHPEDVAEIETMAREVAKTKHCQPTK